MSLTPLTYSLNFAKMCNSYSIAAISLFVGLAGVSFEPIIIDQLLTLRARFYLCNHALSAQFHCKQCAPAPLVIACGTLS